MRSAEASRDYIEVVGLELDPILQKRMSALLKRKLELYTLPKEELLRDWDCFNLDTDVGEPHYNTYKSIYSLASKLRGAGKHELSKRLFREAYDIVILIKSRGIKSKALFIRETSCHDSRIECNNKLQVNQLQSMNELHQYSFTIFDELKEYVELSQCEEFGHMLDTLDISFAHKHAIDIPQLMKFIEYIFEYHKSTPPTPEEAVHLWKITFYLTRLTLRYNKFYRECTGHLEKADEMGGVSIKAAEISVDYRRQVPEDVVANDRLGILPTLSELTKWLPIYKDMFAASREKLQQKNDSTMSEKSMFSVQDIMDNFKTNEDLEGAIEVVGISLFNETQKDRRFYQMKMQELDDLFDRIPKTAQFLQQVLQIKIYQALAALRYISVLELEEDYDFRDITQYLDQANNAFDEATTLSSQIEGGENHISNKWIAVIMANLELINHRAAYIQSSTKADVFDVYKDEQSKTEEVDPEKENRKMLSRLHQIESLFPDYRIERDEVLIKRQKVAYLPQEAEINFILGVVEFQKAQLFEEKLKKLKTSDYPKGDPELNDMIYVFDRARARLCTAHNILTELGSGDERLLNEIDECYRKLLAFNYRISGVPEDQIAGMLDFDMKKVAKDYQLEAWTNVFYKLARGNKFADEELFRSRLAESLQESAVCFAPMILELRILKKGDEIRDERYRRAVRNSENFSRSGAKESCDDPNNIYSECSPDFDYFDEEGFVSVLPIDDNDDYQIIVVTEYPLKDATKKTFTEDIGEGIALLFKMNELKGMDTSEMTEDELYHYDIECLEGACTDHMYLMKRHPETLEHENRVAQMLKKAARRINMNEDLKIDNPFVEYIGLLHDTGKGNPAIDPHLLLNKRWRLLPFERTKIEMHGIAGPDFLRDRLELDRFRDFIAIIAAHHVKYYGRGYPVSLNGNEIVDINDHLKVLYSSITADEWNYLSGSKLSAGDALLARLIVIIDVFEALTSNCRAYKIPFTFERIFGIFNSDTGEHFDPYAMKLFIEMFNEGIFDDLLDYEPYREELAEDNHFEAHLVEFYSLDHLVEFVEEKTPELNENFGLDFNEYIAYLKNGKKKNILFNLRKIRADIFQAYKRDLGYAEAKEKDNNCDVFVKMFLDWMKKHKYSPIEPTPISISEEEGNDYNTSAGHSA